jgi:glutathione S-transferase
VCDYKLYYWNAPFRGNFVQLILAEKDCDYQRLEATEIYPQRSLKINYPGMAPPYLYDCKTKKYLTQMPAMLMYLGAKHGLLPKPIESQYLAFKIIADCHDVLLEITNCYGEKMWSRKEWNEFRKDRFASWLKIFEKIGGSHGLKKTSGFLLGSKLSIADLAVTALLGPILHTFPKMKSDINAHAPYILALCQRVESRPQIAALLQNQRSEWGDIYCGGEIEKSLRKMNSL